MVGVVWIVAVCFFLRLLVAVCGGGSEGEGHAEVAGGRHRGGNLQHLDQRSHNGTGSQYNTDLAQIDTSSTSGLAMRWR